MGKIMTVGIVSLSAIEGIGAHRVHSSESVNEMGVVVCSVSFATIAGESLPRHRLYSQIEADIPNTADRRVYRPDYQAPLMPTISRIIEE